MTHFCILHKLQCVKFLDLKFTMKIDEEIFAICRERVTKVSKLKFISLLSIVRCNLILARKGRHVITSPILNEKQVLRTVSIYGNMYIDILSDGVFLRPQIPENCRLVFLMWKVWVKVTVSNSLNILAFSRPSILWSRDQHGFQSDQTNPFQIHSPANVAVVVFN